MRKPRIIDVIVYEDDSYSFYGNPLELIEFIQEITKDVPKEFSDSLTISIDSEIKQEAYGGFEYSVILMSVYYSRPETKSEKQARFSSRKKAREDEKERELKILKKLQKKHPVK